jgi:hypothetical protein
VKSVIEKNVPLPFPRIERGYWVKIAAAMEVGDSVFVPNQTSSHQTTLGACLRKLGARVAQRKEGDGIRVWRTK